MKLIIFCCLLVHAIQFARCQSLNDLIKELLRLKYPSQSSLSESEFGIEERSDGLLMLFLFLRFKIKLIKLTKNL